MYIVYIFISKIIIKESDFYSFKLNEDFY